MRAGERVFILLKEKKKQQKELAVYLGVTPSTVNGWKNENKNPSSELIVPISEFFGISTDCFFSGKESNSPSLRDDELELLSYYNDLSSLDRGRLLGKLEDQTQEVRLLQEEVG